MKQRISVEQLQELSAEQQERLREHWQPQEGDYYTNGTSIYYVNSYRMRDYVKSRKDYLPLYNIGQCIELLQEKDFIAFHKVMSNWLEPKIMMTLIDDGPREYKPFYQIQRTELIDALWEAVKCVL